MKWTKEAKVRREMAIDAVKMARYRTHGLDLLFTVVDVSLRDLLVALERVEQLEAELDRERWVPGFKADQEADDG